jgi:hypothetical protein
VKLSPVGFVVALLIVRLAAVAVESRPPTVTAAGEALQGVRLAQHEAVSSGIPPCDILDQLHPMPWGNAR